MSVEAYPLTMSSFEGVSGSRMKPRRPEGPPLTGSWGSLYISVLSECISYPPHIDQTYTNNMLLQETVISMSSGLENILVLIHLCMEGCPCDKNRF